MKTSLLLRVAEGDQEAVEQCIDTYGGIVWSIALRLCPTRPEAEDAVQEVFIHLWQKASRFDPQRSSEKTFVALIARRRIIDRLRRSQSRPVTEPIDETLAEPVSRHDQEIEQGAEASIALKAFQALQPQQRKVLLLSIYQGLSHGEIARATRIPLGTVKSYITRGLAQVRQSLFSPGALSSRRLSP